MTPKELTLLSLLVDLVTNLTDDYPKETLGKHLRVSLEDAEDYIKNVSNSTS